MAPRPSSATSMSSAVVAPVEQHPGIRRPRMLDHVRERLLHDAVRDQVEPRRQRSGRALVTASTATPAPRTVSSRASSCSRPGCGARSASGARSAFSMPISRRISARPSRPVASMRPIAALAASGSSFDHRPCRAGLHDHHAHRVRHDVVQLPGDPGPFLHDGVVCGPLAIERDAPSSVVPDPPDQHRQPGRERRGDGHLHPVRSRGTRAAVPRSPRRSRSAATERSEALARDVGRRGVRRDRHREHEVEPFCGRRQGHREREHRHEHRDRPATTDREREAPAARSARTPRARARAVRRPERAGADRADHGHREHRRGERSSPTRAGPPGGAVPRASSVPCPDRSPDGLGPASSCGRTPRRASSPT